MKLLYTKTFVYFLSLLMVTILVSCGTAQTVAGSDDGIYADDIETPVVKEPTRSVIAANTKKSDNNYFTKELERLEDLKGTDIITDIENYKSNTYEIDGSEEILDQEKPKTRITYNQNAPWGYNSSNADVVVNINTFGGGYGWNTYGPFWDPYWDNWGWNNRWGWNNWRWNRWGWNDSYWHPYHRGVFIGVGYDPFFCPPYYNYGYYGPRSRYYNGYYNNRYYNYRRGRNPYRGSYGVTSRHDSYRRGVNASRGSSTIYRRGTNSGSSNRNSNYSTRRGTHSNRSYTPSRRSSRGSNNRSYTPSRSTRSSNRSYTPSRSSRSSNNRSYSPSRSNRSSRNSNSYTPSRSNRSYSPSRSSNRSYTRSRSRR